MQNKTRKKGYLFTPKPIFTPLKTHSISSVNYLKDVEEIIHSNQDPLLFLSSIPPSIHIANISNQSILSDSFEFDELFNNQEDLLNPKEHSSISQTLFQKDVEILKESISSKLSILSTPEKSNLISKSQSQDLPKKSQLHTSKPKRTSINIHDSDLKKFSIIRKNLNMSTPEAFQIILNQFQQHSPISSNPNSTSQSSLKKVKTSIERSQDRNEKIENIPILSFENPAINSLRKNFHSNTQAANVRNASFVIKRCIKDIDTYLGVGGAQKLFQVMQRSDEAKRFYVETENKISEMKYRENHGLTPTNTLKFLLEDLHYVGFAFIDKMREKLPGLKVLPCVSTLSHLKSYIYDYCRFKFQVKLLNGTVQLNSKILVEKLKEYFLKVYNLNFESICVQADADKNTFRVTLKPLFTKKECYNIKGIDRKPPSYFNQNSKFQFPLLITKKENESIALLKNLGLDDFTNLKLNVFLTLDLGFIFKTDRICPTCFLHMNEFQDYKEDNTLLNSTKYQEFFGIKSLKMFIPCILHLPIRLCIFLIIAILQNDLDGTKEVKLTNWLQTIRKGFKFVHKVNETEADTIECWLNYNEIKSVIKNRNQMFQHIEVTDNIKSLFQLLENILDCIEHFSVKRWVDKENQKTFKGYLSEFSKLILLVNRGKHFYYSHITADHLLNLIIFLNSYNLTLNDFALYSLENLHCLSNHYSIWHSAYTYMRVNGKDYKLPYSYEEHEMLRKLAIIILALDPSLTIGKIKEEPGFNDFRLKRINESKVEFERKPKLPKYIDEEEDPNNIDEIYVAAEEKVSNSEDDQDIINLLNTLQGLSDFNIEGLSQ